MNKSILMTSFACLAMLFSFGCGGEDSTRTGNSLVCHSGSCSTSCSDDGTSDCNVMCQTGTTCDARCNAGQVCNFDCQGDAMCTFDCTGGACQAAGTDCNCSGDCTGTCGGSPGGGGDAGPDGTCECGAPTDPGYAACIAAC